MNIEGSTRAIFQSEDSQDVIVTIWPYKDEGVAFTIQTDNISEETYCGNIPNNQALQTAEAFEFIANTLYARIPERLSPFAKGWINAAAQVHEIIGKTGFWKKETEEWRTTQILNSMRNSISILESRIQLKDREEQEDPEFPGHTLIEAAVTELVVAVMDLAHVNGWKIPQLIEAEIHEQTK